MVKVVDCSDAYLMSESAWKISLFAYDHDQRGLLRCLIWLTAAMVNLADCSDALSDARESCTDV